jgi:small subunit ribosomal protein S15
MAFDKASKVEVLKKYQRHDNDTASPEVQIALLTARLNYLNDHFQTNKKDFHSRRGLMKIVGRRKRLLTYLQSQNQDGYKKLITELGIRK